MNEETTTNTTEDTSAEPNVEPNAEPTPIATNDNTEPEASTTENTPRPSSDVLSEYSLDDDDKTEDNKTEDDKTESEFSVEWPEDFSANDELTDMVNSAAREVGVNDKAIGAYTAKMIEQLEAKNLAMQEADDAALKEAWGRDFLSNSKAAKDFAKRVISETDLTKQDLESFLNPKGMKVLYALSQKMGGGKTHGIERSSNSTEMSWAKAAMSDPNHADYKALKNVRDPRHKEVTARYFRAMGAKLN